MSNPERMRQHVTLLGALHIAFGVILLLLAIVVFTAVVGGGIISGDSDVMFITGTVGTLVGGFLALLSLPGIIAGFGLLNYRPWARIVAMILGAVNLLNIPFGTALGIYTLWVLLQPDTTVLFEGAPASVASAARV
jgi:hypothetical protein